MSCEAFDRWLDEGQPPPSAGSMLAHARDCERCRRALAAANALDRALGADLPPAPPPSASFTAAVMARIEPARLAAEPPLRLPPLWLRIARDPAVLGGAVVAALAFAQRDALEHGFDWLATRTSALANASAAAGAPAATGLARWFERSSAPWNGPGGEWVALTIAATTVIPLSWWLYRSSQRWIVPRPRWR